MKFTRKTYTTRREKVIDFVIGVVGWIVLNVILWGVAFALQAAGTSLVAQGLDPMIFNPLSTGVTCVPLVINLVALIVLGLTRYWIALGALAAFAALQLLAICLGVIVGTICFVSLISMGNTG